MKKLILAVALMATSFAHAGDWKKTEYGEDYVISTNFNPSNPDAVYSAAIFSDWTESTDGKDEVRAVTFAGHDMDAGADNVVCKVTAVVNGERIKTFGVSTTSRKGQLPTIMVMESTDPEYISRVPNAGRFIATLSRSKEFMILVTCGDKVTGGTYEPTVSWTELKKAR